MNAVLQGKQALVTGANGGLGHAIATELASQGCNLLLTSRKPSQLAEVAEELKKSGAGVEAFPADLADAADVEKLIAQVRRKSPRLDVLINCAGLLPVGPIATAEVGEFDRCFAVNVRAPFLLCRAFLPDMAKQRWGRVVNVGSSSAFSGFKNTSIYCASKHALLGLSRSLHQEMRGENVRVISVNPGSIRTAMGKKIPGQDFDTFLDPVDVARYIVFAISFDSELVSEEIRLNRMDIQ